MKGEKAEVGPMEIERRSMEIIRSELGRSLPEETESIVMRVIHATADFSFADSLRFTPGVVEEMRGLLRSGASVVTDTTMALAGISKGALSRTGSRGLCFIGEEDVAREAKARGVTRSFVAMERALALPGPKLLVCGNAPTFLLALLERERPGETAVIGVPVGFVNVVEAKERLWESGLPCIVSMGRRGGSTVAAAIVNALLYGMEGVRA